MEGLIHATVRFRPLLGSWAHPEQPRLNQKPQRHMLPDVPKAVRGVSVMGLGLLGWFWEDVASKSIVCSSGLNPKASALKPCPLRHQF